MNLNYKGSGFGRILGALCVSAVLVACNGNNDSASDTANVAASATVMVAANTAYSFRPRLGDGSLSFIIANKPDWASFNEGTGELSGTPTLADTGQYPDIVISANDGNKFTALPPFSIEVTPPVVNGAGSSSSSGTNTSTDSSAAAGSSSSGSSGGNDVASGSSTSGSSSSSSSSSSSGGNVVSVSSSSSSSSSSGGKVGSGSSSSSSSSSSGGRGATGSSSSGSGSGTVATASVTLSWAAPTQNTDGSALTNLVGFNIYYGTSASALTQKISINSVGLLSYVVTDLTPGTWYFEVIAVSAAGADSGPSSVVSTTI